LELHKITQIIKKQHLPPPSLPPSLHPPIPNDPLPPPSPINSDPDIVEKLSGEWFLRTGTTYVTRDIDNFLELAPLFNPTEQGWFLNETLPGIYTIQNIHNNLYMTGYHSEPIIVDGTENTNKRLTESVPHILVELKPKQEDFMDTQYWEITNHKFDDSYNEMYNFGIKLWSNGFYVGVYEHRGNVMFGETFHKWNFTKYDNVIPDQHDHSKGNTTKDLEPSGTIMWYRNIIWKIKHKHIGKILFAKPDNTIGLLDDYNLEEQIWNVTKGTYPGDFTFELASTGLFLTETENNTVVIEALRDSGKDLHQYWMLRSSSVKRINGLMNSKTGNYIYINDPDGWTLTTEKLHPGWNSWEFVVGDPTIIDDDDENDGEIEEVSPPTR